MGDGGCRGEDTEQRVGTQEEIFMGETINPNRRQRRSLYQPNCTPRTVLCLGTTHTRTHHTHPPT